MRPTALITGASRGIGQACARLFSQKGYNIAIVYKTEAQKADALVLELNSGGGNARSFCCDASLYEQAHQTVQSVVRCFGKIDLLVNNCGVSSYALFQDISPEEWGRVMKVNLDSAYNFSSCVLADMLARKEGCIVNISSMWGLVGAAMEVHYSASKAAIVGFTKALAKELCYSRVRVNCVAPGITQTDMITQAFSPAEIEQLKKECPLGRLATPEEIAEGVYYLATAQYVTGAVLNMSGGFVID